MAGPKKRKTATSTRKTVAKKKKTDKSSTKNGNSGAQAASSSSASSNNGTSSNNNAPPGFNIKEIGGPVIKSPLDSHGYKMVELAENGLKGLLVSTCIHPRGIDIGKKRASGRLTNCEFGKVSEFNETYVNFKTKISKNEKGENSTKDDGAESKTYKFSKATKKQQKESYSKRAKVKGLHTKPKVKCRRGIHEQDDEMQSFCNKKCLAVLYVKAGFFQDPPKIPGMAHFCEHALSLGSKNYPEVEAFTKFVEEEGGEYNARTEHECTIFYFWVNYEKISQALDMFVDMFANPNYRSSDLPKEIDNINSEFEMKRLLDELRHRAILQTCVHDDHPATHFGMGCKDTLAQDDIMRESKEWIEKHYFGENMILALQGPLSLEQLEYHFGEFSSKISKRKENSSLTRQVSSKHNVELPFNMNKWNRLFHMDIAGTTNFMTISWPLDPKFGKNYETKPIRYFSYILNYKGLGSLDWYLKQKGWITSLAVNTPEGSFYCTEYYTIFSINLELTSEGLEQRMTVLRAVFNFIKLLQEKKASLEIFDEIRQLQADIFHYRSDTNLSDPTFGRKFDVLNVNETLWSLLHVMSKTEKPEQLLLSAFLVRKWDPKLLDEFVNSLQPEKANVVFAAKEFAEKATETEKWYQAKYYTKPMTARFRGEVMGDSILKELSFPKSNPFIAVSFCYPDTGDKDDRIERQNDLLVYESLKGYVKYGNAKCQKGLLPSAQYILDFESPALEDDTDLINVPCSDIFVSLLKYILDVELGSALSSLISYELEGGHGFIRVILSGPSPKLPELARTIFSTIEHFDVRANQYPKTVQDFKRIQVGFYKDRMDDLELCAYSLLEYVLSQRHNFLSDFVHILEGSLEDEDFVSFIRDFKRRLFVTGDLNGCVSKKHAINVGQIVDNFRCKPYMKKMEHETVDRCIEIPIGERCLLVSAKQKENRNVVVLNYYQIGKVNKDEKKMLKAISAYLGESVFEELRTKKSLGYDVQSEMNTTGGTYGITVFVQGAADKHTSGYINECIDDFMDTVFKDLFASPGQFKEKIAPWTKEGERLNFKATEHFYASRLLSSGVLFRKLSVQIQGHKKATSSPMPPTEVDKKVAKYSSGVKLVRMPTHANRGLSPIAHYLDLCLKDVQEENGYFITDVHYFKNSRQCLPNLGLDSSDDDEDVI